MDCVRLEQDKRIEGHIIKDERNLFIPKKI